MSDWDPYDDADYPRPRRDGDEDSDSQQENPGTQVADTTPKSPVPAEIDEDAEDTDIDESGEEEETRALQSDEGDVSFAYTAGGKQGDANIRRRSKRRRLYAKFALLFLFPTIGIVFLFVLSGPLKLVQIGKLLGSFHDGSNQTASNSRIGRMLEYYRTGNDPSKRNVNFLAEKVSGRMQSNMRAKGMDIKYVNPDGTPSVRMQSMEINTNTPEGKRMVEGLKAEGFTVPDPDIDGKSTIDFRSAGERNGGLSARQRRKALNISIDVQGKNKVTSAITKRLLRARAGVDFHPLKNFRRDKTEQYKDWRDTRKKERAERNTNGSDPPDTSIAGDSTPNEDGSTSPDPETSDAANGSNSVVDDIADVDVDADAPSVKKGIMRRLVGGAGIATSAVGILCMLKNDIGDRIPEAQHAARVLPAVRAGVELLAVSSQVQAGFSGQASFPSLDEMQMFSELIDGTPLPTNTTALLSQKALAQDAPTEREIASSRPLLNALSIERQNGNAVGGTPLPQEMQIASDVSDKPALFDAIDQIPVLGDACQLQNDLTSFIKKIPIVGGIVGIAETVSAGLIDGALGVAGTSMEEIMTGALSWFAKDSLDVGSAAGALLGGIADVGMFLAEKEQGNATGGGELTNAELVLLKQDAWESDQFVRSGKSFFTRMFDIRDSESMLAQAIIKAPSFRTDTTISQNLASLYSSTLSNVAQIDSIFMPKAKAQEPIAFDYGVNASGFSIGELEAELTADPVANAAIVEPRLAELNETYSGCFGTKIDPDNNFAMTFEPSPNYEMINDPKCKDGSEILLRYRFYILDNVSLRAMACYEGLDEQSCNEIGVSGAAVAAGSTTQGGASAITAPGLNGYTIGCQGIPATPETRGPRGDDVNWAGIPDSGTIGTNSAGQPMKVYIREPCDNTNAKTVVIGSSIHASENYGQPVSFDLLFRKTLPANMRVIAIPEINGSGLTAAVPRVNANGVNLNRNYDYRWGDMAGDELTAGSTNYRGSAPGSEPETQAVMSFMTGLGDAVSLFLVYHDNLNYVGSAGETSPAIATKYRDYLSAAGVSIGLGNSGGVNIKQRGSLDGWYNQVSGKPTLLLEMPSSVDFNGISAHSQAIIGLVENEDI